MCDDTVLLLCIRVSSEANFASNQLVTAGAVFTGYTGTQYTVLNLTANALQGIALSRVLNSFSNSTSDLTLILDSNNITILPALMFQGFGQAISANSYPRLQLQLRNNPLQEIATLAFAGGTGAWIGSIILDLSGIQTFAVPLALEFTSQYGSCVLLSVNLSGTGMHASVLNAFATQTCTELVVDLTRNAITNVTHLLPDVAFDVYLNFSHNAITLLSENVFRFRGNVDLSYNSITSIPSGAFNGSKLMYLNMSYNEITSVRTSASHSIPRVFMFVIQNSVELSFSFSFICDNLDVM